MGIFFFFFLVRDNGINGLGGLIVIGVMKV